MGDINPHQTPVKATVAVVILVCGLALSFAIEILAETTSLMILIIATLVNGAPLRIKLRESIKTNCRDGGWNKAATLDTCSRPCSQFLLCPDDCRKSGIPGSELTTSYPAVNAGRQKPPQKLTDS